MTQRKNHCIEIADVRAAVDHPEYYGAVPAPVTCATEADRVPLLGRAWFLWLIITLIVALPVIMWLALGSAGHQIGGGAL